MSITSTKDSYILDNGNGLSAEILSYGAIIKRLIFKGTDVVLGRETSDYYNDNEEYFGAVIGRTAGRIRNGIINIEGKDYSLSINSNDTCLHGGFCGFDKKEWKADTLDSEEPSLSLSLLSPDGEEGFPGNLEVKAVYTLKSDNSLSVKYFARTDKTTVFEPTNHTYFNLNGHNSGRVDGHIMQLDNEFFLANALPPEKKGEVYSVIGTALDYRKEKPLSEAFSSDHPEALCALGFDHLFLNKGTGFKKVGQIRGDKSKITMEIYTDRKGLCVYTAAYIRKGLQGKDGASYGPAHGICFETRNFDFADDIPLRTSGILKPGENFEAETVYSFSSENNQ